MTEQKRPIGRPTIYDGSRWGRGYTDRSGSVQPRSGQREQSQGQAEPVKQDAVQQDLQRPLMRRRDQENEQKMRQLRIVLGILVLLLTAAIFHEIILGHGTKMTGQERMAAEQQKKQNVIILQQTETDPQE